MPASTAARGPAASPGRGPMAPGQAVPVMLVLVLSTLWVCEAMPPPEPGQHHGAQWVWGAAGQAQAEPLPLSRRKRADGGHQPSATATTPGHGHDASTMLSSNTSDSPEPNLLLSSAPAPAPSTNASLQQALVVPTTADPQDETDSPDPDLLLGSTPAPSTNASLQQALTAPTTADPQDETDSPDPDLLLGSTPAPAPSTNASLQQALTAPTTADPQDETDSPDPDLLQGSEPAEPSTQAAPQKSITTIPSWLTSPGEEKMVANGTDSSSVTPPALDPTTTGYKKVRKAGTPPATTGLAPGVTQPRGTTAPLPWDPSRVMGKCLLAILLLALVAATFMVCTGVLGTLLWRRARTGHRRFSRTEMICISSLLPDGEVATNGPKAGPARRPKLLLNGSSEADGDNLTLSSFLPEHS
ncbi:P-selectin glycoprotein ligand 1 [Falco naumanni]|uniref:P-selectin glycoprotein ligand 1 n=1 Tax=Falco naumanni TaxID=148594 RepID=UPI001ADE5DB0|nr:P-selectin glycoprotein ligand 1 [Falco naumanni]